IALASNIIDRLLFFFQAEDGIRDGHVTGVQTCALPISHRHAPVTGWAHCNSRADVDHDAQWPMDTGHVGEVFLKALDRLEQMLRSEERRVGKECRSRWGRDDEKKKIKRKSELKEKKRR